MKRFRIVCLLPFVFAAFACGKANDGIRPLTSTSGLGEGCPDGGCLAGQDCVTANVRGESITTCQILCQEDSECPKDLSCNLDSSSKDSIPNTCVE